MEVYYYEVVFSVLDLNQWKMRLIKFPNHTTGWETLQKI